ncbi:hypothetical protein SAMN05660748_1860 [Blastococcus aggregatus]|uniref:Uncharacterized protein n=1 Tax=Blastococcus aggregatus TaxID=38502 RepID=A0A285V4V7_9ACTN|nr:hypothetical protein [Blastococcus aggregatus]SOC49142.1 hypothetical protein SAMN05660748_1860 [Blastococcus aggregatus]
MTALVPDPVPLGPPPGDPRAIAALAGRLDRAGLLLGELGEQVTADGGAVPSWTGRDADAATARLLRAGALVREAAEGLVRAGTRLALHADLLEDARGRLARQRDAQEEDFAAAAARLGGVQDVSGTDTSGALEELRTREAARRRVAAAIREEVAEDAAATAAVLAGAGAVAVGAGRAGDGSAVLRHLAEVLPGWREVLMAQRGRAFAATLLADDGAVRQEQAARELLPEVGDPAVAAAVLTGLGPAGFRDVLRRLGEGSLSSGSALARVMAGVLGAPVPLADAAGVARVREGRLVDPGDHHTLDSDLVALGMGVVLAAGRGSPAAGPPLTTVREWGRQIVARERALGAERIVDHVRPGPAEAPPGDPLEEVLVRLATADDPAPAAALLRAVPTWSLLLERTWDDDGAAFAALVGRAAAEPGDVAVRAGLSALAVGLRDDGDPAGWTVDRGTAAAITPALAEAVAARPEVLTAPLLRDGGPGGDDRTLLRGLGYLGADPAAGPALDRGVAEAAVGLRGADHTGARDPAVAVIAGYTAVREYGQRLVHALDEFAAQEHAVHQQRITELLKAASDSVTAVRVAVAAVAVVRDLDGTWDGGRDDGQHLPVSEARRATGGAAGAAEAYAQVAGVLGTPTAPVSPGTDWIGLALEVVPGGDRLRDVVEQVHEQLTELWTEHREDAAGG